MIHYTLLPKEEMRDLRKEYRIRLFIVASFFVSCGIVVGIISLLPAYIFSHNQEVQAVAHANQLNESRKASGVDEIERELVQSQKIAEKLAADGATASYSAGIQRIISHRSSQLYLTSFEITPTVGSTTYDAVVQGKALTREALLEFQDGLKSDAFFSKIDLPLSDLAKSKNVTFTLKLVMSLPGDTKSAK